MVRLRSSLWVLPAAILCRDFSSTLTTVAFDHSRLRRFEACSCKPAPRGPPSSSAQLRTLYEKVRSWHTILRIPEKYQNYRYARISQLLKAGQFCRYVGDINGFVKRLFMWFLADISKDVCPVISSGLVGSKWLIVVPKCKFDGAILLESKIVTYNLNS